MRILSKEEANLEKENLVAIIKKGALFVYPTDTIYGLGCNAQNEKAVHKVRETKRRMDQPFSVIVPGKDWIRKNCEVSKKAIDWIKKLPGPYTLILKLKNKDCIAKNVAPGLDTIGIRIPDHWITDFIAELGIPVITTSANVAGGNFMTSLEDLELDIKSRVDFIVYEGELRGRPSTLVHLEGEEEKIKER